MRRPIVLALLGCPSSGGGSSQVPPAQPDRILLVAERARVYRTRNDNVTTVDQLAPGTVDQAVQALVGAYGELGIDVNTIEPRAGRVGARAYSAPSRIGGKPLATFVDCGTDNFGNPRASTYAVVLDVTSAVEPASAGYVRASTLLTARGRQRGVSSDPIVCTTTGALEKRINVLMASRMAK